LGAVRAKVGDKGHLPAIAIPIPQDDDRTHYYQKKRIAPWIDGNDTARNNAPPWSQYGIPQMVYFTHKPEDATETWLCEGEWDAIRLGWEMRHQSDIAVACFTCGAGNVPPDTELARLPGTVIIWYDLDEPGRKGANKVLDRMKDRAGIATVPSPPEAPEGWDASDSLNHGFTLRDFSEAADKAIYYQAPKKENKLRSRLLTNDELIAGAPDYVEWLVPDILTQDELFVLGMPPRGGKSLFALTLAKAVASGGTFLDRPVTQGSVIYVNLEDAPSKVKQRQLAQNWAEGLPVYWLDKFKLSELPELKELGDELPDLRLVILDTFSRIRDDGFKESSAELGKTLEPLQEWAKERGICILLTHHTGKLGQEHQGGDPFDMLRGSTSIRATCRGAIVIVPGDGSYRLLAENGFSDRLDVAVRINPENLEWKLMGNWQPRIDGDMKAQILDHLNLVGEATVAEIATALNFNAASVSTIMSRLHRDGLVSKRGGRGRSPGLYMRSLNLLKQLEAQFEQPNPDAASSIDVAQTKNLSKDSSAKVINEGKSDHEIDHLCPNPHKDTKVFEQAQNPSPEPDTCSNSTTPEFEQVGTKVISVGSQVIYTGARSSLARVCGRKKLTVTALKDEQATINHPDWVVDHTVPLTDLKVTR
jgi:hypothetical protein